MGLLAAIAGMVTMARLNSANPQAGTNFEMDAIGACFIVVLLLMAEPVQFRGYHWCIADGCAELRYEYHGY